MFAFLGSCGYHAAPLIDRAELSRQLSDINDDSMKMRAMNKFYEFAMLGLISASTLIAGCVGSGYGDYGTGVASSAMSAAEQAAVGSVINSTVGSVAGAQGDPMNTLIQSMAASVLNGQIGSQIHPADQPFRLQQLNGVMQSAAINQPQQWSNPQTGNMLAVNPVGDAMVDPNTQQNCRNLEEVYTMTNGQTIREMRRACQDTTGKWVLVQ